METSYHQPPVSHKGDPDVMEVKWQNKMNQVQDIHEHSSLQGEELNKGAAETR